MLAVDRWCSSPALTEQKGGAQHPRCRSSGTDNDQPQFLVENNFYSSFNRFILLHYKYLFNIQMVHQVPEQIIIVLCVSNGYVLHLQICHHPCIPICVHNTLWMLSLLKHTNNQKRENCAKNPKNPIVVVPWYWFKPVQHGLSLSRWRATVSVFSCHVAIDRYAQLIGFAVKSLKTLNMGSLFIISKIILIIWLLF